MKRLGIAALLLLTLEACAPNTAAQQGHANWDQMGSHMKVAKVSNLKSLIMPGFY